MGRISAKKVAFTLLLALFLVAAVGGVFSLCGMSPMDHLTHWQEISATTVQQMSSTVLLLFMTVVAFLYFLREAAFLPQRGGAFGRYRGGGRVFDPLRLAFARGILNTKAY